MPPPEALCGHVGRIVVGPEGRDPRYSCVRPAGHRQDGGDARWHEDAYGNRWNYDD